MSEPRSKRRRKAPKNCEWRKGTLWGRKQIAGKLRRWSLRTDNAEVAATRVKEDIARLTAEAFYKSDRISWEDAVTAWGESIVHKVGPRAAARYASSLRTCEPWLLGLSVDQVNTPDHMKKLVTERRAAGVTEATIRRDLTAIGSVLDDQDVDQNFATARSKKLKERRDPIVLPNPAHVARVVARLPGNFAILASVARKTGCRQEELVTAERANVDHARKQLTIRGKRNKVRVIDLAPFGAYEEICKIPPMLGCRWLFWHSGGKPFKNVSSRFADYVSREMRAAERAADAAGHADPDFRKFRFHDLRHLHAVEWLKDGRSIYLLQGRLGHASIKTTEIYLTFLTEEEKLLVKYGPSEAAGHRFKEA